MSVKMLIIPVMGAFIGWKANYITIKLFFHPHKPVQVPYTGLEIWGELPRHQKDLAAYVGDRVEKELLDRDKIMREIEESGIIENLSGSITATVKERVMQKIPELIPHPWRKMIANAIGESMAKEVPAYIEDSLERFTLILKQEMHLRKFVENKVNSFDIRELEHLAMKELRIARIIGGSTGFILGLVIMLIISL